MGKMGKYCKAYPIGEFRAYDKWTENLQNLHADKRAVEGKGGETGGELSENDFLYLQENYEVTDGIFIDENVIFNNVTPEWINYCQTELKFEIPSYDVAETANASSRNDG